ncbi:MAG: 16S rRNA (uracil(1498)-N(3))-methyltransferase [Acidiferrobacterales bacterium]
MTINLKYPWFYLDEIPDKENEVVLSDSEARHATGSRRLEVGSRVCLFNGNGLVAVARIRTLGNRGKNPVLLLEEVAQQSPQRVAWHLASALPKGDRQGVMLDMLTQLGISSFTPLHCEHSVVKASEKSLSRFRRIVIESCKQSRRTFLPEIRPAASPLEVVRDSQGAVWFAHPDGSTPAQLAQAIDNPKSLTIMIGPEGGFSEAEVQLMQDQGAGKVSLGEAILRTETAAVALLSYAGLAIDPR